MFKNIQSLWQNIPQGRLFISYRRDDSRWVAGRLTDSLSQYFGENRIFRDIEHIAGGKDFGVVINDTLDKSDAVLVLIGKNWLEAADEKGHKRIDDPNDWVAQEIGTALERGIPVYPILIEDTRMPQIDDLPERLQPLARLNAISISDSRWNIDVDRLAKIISLDIPSITERKLQGLNRLISFALAASVLFSSSILFWNLVCFISQESQFPAWLSWLCTTADSGPTNAVAIPLKSSKEWPLSLAFSGVPFLAIVPSSALLFSFADLIEKTRRPYYLGSAWTGALGSFLFFILLKPIPEAYEPVSIFFGGTTIALLMFALMNLSGFKPK